MTSTVIKRNIYNLYTAWKGQLGERLMYHGYRRKAHDFLWIRGSSCPKRRVEANGVVIGNKLFLFGGYESIERVLSRCDVYDLTQNKWVDHFATPADMAQTHAGIVTDSKRYIYAIGGQVGPHCFPCTNKCFVFDVQTKTFSDFISLPEPRYLGIVQYWNGRIHVIGGLMPDRFTATRSHWSIGVKNGKETEESWREEPSIPRGGIHGGSVIIDNALYVISGQEGDVRPIVGDLEFKCNWNSPPENIHGEVYRFDFGDKTWKRLAGMPIKLAHIDTATVGTDKSIYVFGGTERRGICTNSVWRYDIALDQWGKCGALPYHMKSSVALKFGSQFVLVTGQRARGARNHRTYNQMLDNVWITRIQGRND